MTDMGGFASGDQKSKGSDLYNLVSNQDQVKPTESESSLAHSLGREARLLTFGVLGAAGDTIKNPSEKLPEIATAATLGGTMAVLHRAGMPGKLVAAGTGSALLAKTIYDEYAGSRWSTLGTAISDTWKSGANMERNVEATRASLGSLAFDIAIGTAGFKLGSKLATSIKGGISPKQPSSHDSVASRDLPGPVAQKVQGNALRELINPGQAYDFPRSAKVSRKALRELINPSRAYDFPRRK